MLHKRKAARAGAAIHNLQAHKRNKGKTMTMICEIEEIGKKIKEQRPWQ